MTLQRVVILGGAGFVGSHIARALDTTRYETISVSRRECDFADPSATATLAGLIRDGDIVVTAAAKAPAKNWEMLTDNITMIGHIAEALRGKKLAYLLNISSDAVYGDSMEPMAETAPLTPMAAHGIMHCMREYILGNSVDAPMGNLRPTLIYGAGDPHNGYGPNSFLRLAAEGTDISLFGEGEERRDHVWVGDVAALAVRMIDAKTTGAVNAVSGTVISFMDIAQAVREASGNAVNIVTKPRSGPMPHNGYRAFDNAHARAVAPGLQFTQLRDYIRTQFPAQQKSA